MATGHQGGPGPSLTDLAWPVHTARLSLRPLQPGDVDALWAYRDDPELQRWTGRSPARRDDLVEQFFCAEALARTLVMVHEGAVVGDLMVQVRDGWSQHDVVHRARGSEAMLGWTLGAAHRGRGLASEAVGEVLRICFDDLGLRRVQAVCFVANTASWRLMERLGMRRETHAVADSLHRDEGWLDTFGYALLADEWRAGRTDVSD